jgi:hypothetical protein
MRRILLAAILAIICQAAHANDPGVRLAQAQPDPPAAQPQAAPELQASPSTATTSDAGQPSTKAAKPAKKRVVRRGRTWEADEVRARAIAAKYGVYW